MAGEGGHRDRADVFPYDYVIESTEKSLRNLKLEAVDLQQLHVWNTEWTERDEWKRAFEDLKKSGKAKAVGVSLNAGDPDSGLALIKHRPMRFDPSGVQHFRPVTEREFIAAGAGDERRRAGARASR